MGDRYAKAKDPQGIEKAVSRNGNGQSDASRLLDKPPGGRHEQEASPEFARDASLGAVGSEAGEEFAVRK